MPIKHMLKAIIKCIKQPTNSSLSKNKRNIKKYSFFAILIVLKYICILFQIVLPVYMAYSLQ